LPSAVLAQIDRNTHNMANIRKNVHSAGDVNVCRLFKIIRNKGIAKQGQQLSKTLCWCYNHTQWHKVFDSSCITKRRVYFKQAALCHIGASTNLQKLKACDKV
jgi:hypothetical protein